MDPQIEEIKAKTDIVALIGQSVKLTRAGRNFKGLCPFHNEKTPSFMVSPERGTWRCFGCGEHGDAITFLEKHENLTFIEAVEQLARQAGVPFKRSRRPDGQANERQQRLLDLLSLTSQFYHFILLKHPSAEVAREYLATRGVSAETIKQFTLGYAPDSWQSLRQFLQQKGYGSEEIGLAGISSKSSSGREFDRFRGRLMFPISDSVGRVVGFSGRTLSSDPNVPKYLNSPENEVFHKGKLLFGLHQAKEAIRDRSRMVLVEGNIDLLSSLQAGVPEVVAPLGTALTPEQCALIHRFTQNVFLAYDKDKAGQAALWRSVPLLQAQGLDMRVVDLPTGKDPDEFIKNQPNLWQSLVDEAKPVFDYLLSRLHQDYDTDAPKGKRSAMEAVKPFIQATADEVERQFLVHRAANAIGIDEGLMRSELGTNRQAPMPDRRPQPGAVPPPSSSRQETLARHLLGTILSTPPEEVKWATARRAVALPSEALPEPYRPILTAIQAGLSDGQALNLEAIGSSLPQASIGLFDELCLWTDPSLTASDTIGQARWREDIGDRLLHISHQLNTLHLKERLQHITRQIKQAETLNLDDQEALKKEFTQISQKIAQQDHKNI